MGGGRRQSCQDLKKVRALVKLEHIIHKLRAGLGVNGHPID